MLLKISYQRIIKRLLDIGLCSLALVILSPIFLITSIAIKLSSPGPVFYVSYRLGKNKKPFKFYKFRSMHVVAPEKDKGLCIADSNRTFYVGKLIRRLKIDELPQLVNVVLGDMSIVGPRPMIANAKDDFYSGKYEIINSVKPGLTSAASLFDYTVGETFENDNEYRKVVLPKKLELERLYIQKESLLYDTTLVLRTIITIMAVLCGSQKLPKQQELLEIKKSNYSYSRYSVFVFGASGRQVLPVCRGFFELGCEVTVYCKSKLDTGYLTKYASCRLLYDKNNYEKLNFLDFGADIIKSSNYDLVLPLGDEVAKYLSNNKSSLEKYAKIVVNNKEVFQYAIDKYKTMKICQEIGIPSPYTLGDEDPIKEILDKKIKFPLVIKPKSAVGSIGFNIIPNIETLKDYLSKYDNSNGELLIQEYVKQGDEPQYRADLFRDRNGNFKAALVGKVTRWYPLDGGSGIYVETIHNESIIENCKKLLTKIDWNGYANIDLVWDDNRKEAKILEINGRTGASIKLDYIAGINVSRLILENELNLPVTEMMHYEDGKKISCFLPDLLWFIKSPNRFKSKPSWFNRFNVFDTIFSIDDPWPFWGFLLTSITSYSEAMKKRKRI